MIIRVNDLPLPPISLFSTIYKGFYELIEREWNVFEDFAN